MNFSLKTKIVLTISLCFVVFIIIFSILFFQKKPISNNTYYGIFLTNGQTYFGQIQSIDSQSVIITDVFYLRTNPQPQTPQNATDESNVQLSLIKLGDELHGPKDKMTINRTQVLYWEELRDDAKVVQAIKQYKQNKF